MRLLSRRIAFPNNSFSPKNIPGAMWFLQSWLLLHYPETRFSPTPRLLFQFPSEILTLPPNAPQQGNFTSFFTKPAESYAEHYIALSFKPPTSQLGDFFSFYCVHFFETTITPDAFNKYSPKNFPKPSWFNLNPAAFVTLESKLLFRHYISTKYLFVGMNFSSIRMYPSFEYYYPACFANSFNMTQSIPYFILHRSAPHRANLKTPEEVQPLIDLNEELFLRHLPAHIENSHAVSRSFRQYWSSYKEVIFMDCKEILKTRFVFFADDGAESSDASSSSMQGQSQVATSHGGQTPRGDAAADQTDQRVKRRRAPLSTAEAAAKAEIAAQKAAERAEKAKKKLEEERMAQELQEKRAADRSAKREAKKRARERDDQLLDEQRAKTIRSWPDTANPEVVQKNFARCSSC